MKLLIYGAVFGVGVFAGIKFTQWYATHKVTTAGDKVIGKLFGNGYIGQVATGVFNGAVDAGIN
ncbi:MAG TPA: hypothetical protein VK688_01020 [Gemmatimonadales bacterium]|jgi:hypothetical protein|nr:hypothetical protein [Gemmatimonadales bacterium]